jgi:stage III sporulation protein AH
MQRQTTWMVSILTLMVVLSAYYLMTGDVGQMQAVTSDKNEGQVQTETVDYTQQTKSEGEAGATTQTEGAGATDQTFMSNQSSDFFISYKMQRDNLRSMQAEKYMDIISDSQNSKAEEIVEAQTKLEELQSLEYTEKVIEELLAADYGDAVVMTQNDHVKVVVQAESLSNNEVVKILNLVTEQMAVPASKVSVSGMYE